MRLHRRLTLTMAVLLVVGLAIADIVTYTSLRSFLYGRIDAQLDATQHLAYRYLIYTEERGIVPTEQGLDNRVSPDVYVIVLGPDGRPVLEDPSGSPLHPDPQPALPRSLRVAPTPGTHTFGRHHGTYRPEPGGVIVGAVADSGARYQLQAVSLPQGTLVTAVSLNPTDDTLASLVRVELIASGAIVLALCVLALWTVRRGLRPLEDMSETAGAIASGDLTRRVPSEDENTEVGRLGAALNAMLAQIEMAFEEKTGSEARLRQFVADASHELRTPLTSIRGYAELLRKGGFSDEEGRQRALARIEHEAARMGGLVDDLLLLARLDQGRPLEMLPVDLRRVALDAVDDARAVEPGHPIELAAPEPVLVAGDRDRLGQVAHNLVRNALIHTAPGTPVRVEVARRGEVALLSVVDEGPGMDPDQARRAFDRFYRGDASRTGQGTGLGLSIVRAIAEALGGTARAESAPGRGATFAVELPALAGVECTEGSDRPRPEQEPSRRPQFTP
ncbi:MAG: sensor histidine kinase [Acidimicrobiales bacterium]